MVDRQSYIINFDGISDAEANLYAEELRDLLLNASSDVEVERKRNNPLTQDFGTILVLTLGTPSALAIARAIGNWIALRRGSISIETEKGEITKITATNLTNETQLKVLEILAKK